MRVRQPRRSNHRAGDFPALMVVAFAVFAVLLVGAPAAHASSAFDGGGGDQWWFNYENWSAGLGNDGTTASPNYLPPAQQNADTGAVERTDVQFNVGAFNTAEGVVYDPDNDPYYNEDPEYVDPGYMASFTYPTDSSLTLTYGDYGPQNLYRFYLGRGVTAETNPSLFNLVTIKSGHMVIESTTIVGRSGEAGNLGKVVQTGGTVELPTQNLDIGQNDANSVGNGAWEYYGGVLDVANAGADGIRLSAGSSSSDKGAGGVGTFIMHNPGDEAGGFVRTWKMRVPQWKGLNDGVTDAFDPNGVTTGVGIVEFHYENGGTRPIQVQNLLEINNGQLDTELDEDRICSARLGLVLDEAPTVDESGVPQSLALFDVDSNEPGWETGGVIGGAGDLDGDGNYGTDADQVFSNLDNTANYDEGAIVTAMYGGSTYRWNIYYTGNITWSEYDVDTHLPTDGAYVSEIEGQDTGKDIVLIGLDSTIVEGLVGDYNDDGIVDAADYTVWRDNLGTSFALPNRDPANTGNVGPADYASWKAHFGESSPGAGALAAAAVPEPSTLVLMLFVTVLGMARGLASRR